MFDPVLESSESLLIDAEIMEFPDEDSDIDELTSVDEPEDDQDCDFVLTTEESLPS